jgi:hypothetical protein
MTFNTVAYNIPPVDKQPANEKSSKDLLPHEEVIDLERFEAMNFDELIATRQGVDYFLVNHDRFSGLSSDQAWRMIEVMTFDQLPEIFSVLDSFVALDNHVAMYLIRNRWYEPMAAAKEHFLPLTVDTVMEIISDYNCQSNIFKILLPLMALPFDDGNMMKIFSDQQAGRLLAEFGAQLFADVSYDHCLQVALRADQLWAYGNYLRWVRNFQKLKADDELLEKIITANAKQSMKMYLIDIASKNRLEPERAMKVMEYLQVANNELFRQLAFNYTNYFNYPGGHNEFVKDFIKLGQEKLVIDYLNHYHGLSREVFLQLLTPNSAAEMLECCSSFRTDIWNKDTVMRLIAMRESGSLPADVMLPERVILNTADADAELAERLIAVGWGARVISGLHRFKDFTLTPRHLNRIIGLPDQSVATADSTARLPMMNYFETKRLLSDVSYTLDYLPFRLTAEQTELFWQHCPSAILYRPEVAVQGFFTNERLNALIADADQNNLIIYYLEKIKIHSSLSVDNDLFHRLLSPRNISGLWEAREFFDDIVYDEPVARMLLEAGMLVEVAIDYPLFSRFENKEIYLQLFKEFPRRSAVVTEAVLDMMMDHFNGDIETIGKFYREAKAIDAQTPTDDTNRELRTLWLSTPVLSKLIDISSFSNIDLWLNIDKDSIADPYIIEQLNIKLATLVSRQEWAQVQMLLTVMDKHNIEINQAALAENDECLRTLAAAGQLVASESEDKLIKFAAAQNQTGNVIQSRLSALDQKEWRLVDVLRQAADREAAKEKYRQEHRESGPVYEGEPMTINDEIGVFYMKEYVRSVLSQVNDQLRACGQELSNQIQLTVGEKINHDRLVLWLRDYLVTIIDHELTDGPSAVGAAITRERDRKVSFPQMTSFLSRATTEEMIGYLDRAENIFLDKNEWRDMTLYAGPKWAAVAKWTRAMILADQNGDDQARRHAVDTIFSLQHNTGSVFSKYIPDMLVDSIEDDGLAVLNLKFNTPKLIDDLDELLGLLSDEGKSRVSVIVESLKLIPGYDFANHCIDPNTDWRTVRGVKPHGD